MISAGEGLVDRLPRFLGAPSPEQRSQAGGWRPGRAVSVMVVAGRFGKERVIIFYLTGKPEARAPTFSIAHDGSRRKVVNSLEGDE